MSRVAGLDSMLGCCEGWVDTEVYVVMVACRRGFVLGVLVESGGPVDVVEDCKEVGW